MAGEPPGTKRLSKLIGWAHAVECCEQVWREFEALLQQGVEAKIKKIELGGIVKGVTWNQAGPPKAGGFDMGTEEAANAQRMISIEEIRRCADNTKTIFESWKARNLAELEKNLLPQKTVGRVKGVWTRRVRNITPHARGESYEDGHRHRKRGRKRGKKRSHHKGQYKLTHPRNHVRGRPLLNFRQKRERDRRNAAASHAERKATRIARMLKGWKPYVRRVR